MTEYRCIVRGFSEKLQTAATLGYLVSNDFVLNHKTGCFTYLFRGKTLNMQPKIGRAKHCRLWVYYPAYNKNGCANSQYQ
jgi:hypothetical protein